VAACAVARLEAAGEEKEEARAREGEAAG